MIHEDLSGEIIGAAMVVLNELKPGLDEKLYERAMIIELKHRGYSVSVQSSYPVSYRGELIGNLIPDLIVDNAVIVDPKVASCFTDTHVAQMIGYLNITALELAFSLISRMHDWNGNESCGRKNPIKAMDLIFTPDSSYPCHPCNPWFSCFDYGEGDRLD
jgi:GxxExxY protein